MHLLCVDKGLLLPIHPKHLILKFPKGMASVSLSELHCSGSIRKQDMGDGLYTKLLKSSLGYSRGDQTSCGFLSHFQNE